LGAASIKTILTTDPGNLGAATKGVSATPPAPEMMSGAFELTGGQEVEPVQAYVVENDISDAQALQEELDIQATL